MIHSTAVIDPAARIGKDVEIAPFAVIGPNVTIGDGCKIGPHAVITGDTTIGARTVVHTGANIGDAPQDLHYHGERSFTDIGEDCLIREYVTIHRGTEEGSHTVVGNRVLLMAMVHLGHNCQISDDVVIANNTLLAGRVSVAHHAFISAGCMVHQFCRIGRLAMLGGGNAINQDIPPFCLVQMREVLGPNIVGLRRAGFSDETREAIHNAVKIYFTSGYPRLDAIEKIRQECPPCQEITEFVDFILATKRGICSGHRD